MLALKKNIKEEKVQILVFLRLMSINKTIQKYKKLIEETD